MPHLKIFLPILLTFSLTISCSKGSGGSGSTPEPSLDLQFALSNNSIVASGIETTVVADTWVPCDAVPTFAFLKSIGLEKPLRIAYGSQMSSYCDNCIFNIICKPGHTVNLSITDGNWPNYPAATVPSITTFNPSGMQTATFVCPASGVYSETVYDLINISSYGTYEVTVSDDEITDTEYLRCSSVY